MSETELNPKQDMPSSPSENGGSYAGGVYDREAVKQEGGSPLLAEIFNKNNINLILWMLAIFFIIKFVMGVMNGTGVISPAIDVVVFVGIIVYVIYLPKNDDIVSAATTELKREMEDYRTMIYLGVVVAILFAVGMIFGSATPVSLGLLKNIGFVYLIFLGIINFCVYVLKIPVVDMIFSKPKQKEESATEIIKDIVSNQDEVFNVANNLYTYDDAKMVCGALDARLATYDEMEDTYKKGGEWCNYGWSEGQYAYFPTQKETWKKLQSDEKNKHNCGRPGINGGYMENPNIKFGANCFGKRPTAKNTDLLKLNTGDLVAKNPDEIALDQKVNAWKANAAKLEVNPFNHLKWSAM
jgi:hypothetical protein